MPFRSKQSNWFTPPRRKRFKTGLYIPEVNKTKTKTIHIRLIPVRRKQ